MSIDYASILENIETADITLREYRAARRMLDRISDQGTLYLDRQEACDLFGTGTWNDARRILGELKKKGVIECHTNNRAYVIFCAESAHPRAEIAHPRADSAQSEAPAEEGQCADSAHPRAEIAHPRADSAYRCAESARANRQANRQANNSTLDSLPSKPEEGSGETPAPDTAQQARSVALLTDPDVRLDPQLARALAKAYPFEEIRRQIFRLMRDLGTGKVKHPNAIKARLAKRFSATITEQDRASPLWARHATAADLPAQTGTADAYSDLILH
jgi:hypothetical protein